MAKRKHPAPVVVEISEEARERARRANSGGCLIAKALRDMGYHTPEVDIATIRFTDRVAGKRYTYLTPDTAQTMLLWFDQGWQQSGPVRIQLKRPVKVLTVQAGAHGHRGTHGQRRQRAADRAARKIELETKEREGNLTPTERRSLETMRATDAAPPLAPVQRYEPATVDDEGIVHGGRPSRRATNPHLLPGTNRIFGAKRAKPGKDFEDALEKAIREREAPASEPVDAR